MRKKRKYFRDNFVTFCLMTRKIFLELELHIENIIMIIKVIMSGRVNNRRISTNSERDNVFCRIVFDDHYFLTRFVSIS